MGKKDKRPDTPGKRWIEELCELLKGGVLAGTVVLVLLLLGSALMSAGILRERWMEGTVLASCVIGVLFGGGYASIRLGRGSLPVGLAVGLVLSLMLLTLGVLIYDASLAEGGGIKVMASCLCGGGIAGVLFGKPKKKRRR